MRMYTAQLRSLSTQFSGMVSAQAHLEVRPSSLQLICYPTSHQALP